MDDPDKRHRVAILGAGEVGKTSIIRRFLFGDFPTEHTETVEDLFCRRCNVKGTIINVDLLDTAGSLRFPAMRRLSITKAQAFALVYSVTNVDSYNEVKELWVQIKQLRQDYEKIPVVIVGNKVDMENNRIIENFDALDWVNNDGLKDRFVEVSAKTGECIIDAFQILLIQANIPAVKELEPILRRRLSNTAEDQASDNTVDEDKTSCFRSLSPFRRGSRPKTRRATHPIISDCGIS